MEYNIYGVGFVLSVVMLILLILIGRKQNINNYIMIFVAVMISNYGYHSVSVATNLEAALVGQRLLNIGAIFAPVLLLFCAMRLCKIEAPKLMIYSLLIYSLVVAYFSFTIGITDDFYKSVYLSESHGYSILVKEYGKAHILYEIQVFGNVLATLGVLVYSLIKKKNASHNLAIGFILIELLIVGMYAFNRITGFEIELYTVVYILAEVIILIFIRRIGMYEVSDSIANSLNENSNYGYIVVDSHMRYAASNKTAEMFLPEIKYQKVDRHFSPEITPIVWEKFSEWMNDPDGKELNCYIESDERCVKCTARPLVHGMFEKRIGYIIELLDNTQHHKYMELMNNYNTDLEAEVDRQTKHISEMQDKIVLGMADMIENRDDNTGGHVRRTSFVVRFFIEELEKTGDKYGFSPEFLENVAKAAPMHDLGKIAVDDRVLRKPGKYTAEEFEEMKTHSEKGAGIIIQILEGVEDEKFIEIARNVAYFHHEKWNGEGYPQRLMGENIPVEARIMALADVFDALVSKRCYKEKMSYDEAFKIIEDSLGSHFDPELGRLFLKCRDKLEAFYNSLEE